MSKPSPRGSSRGSNSSSSSRPASRGYDFTAEGEVGQFGVNYVPGKGNVRWYSGSFDFQGLPFDMQEAVFRFLTVKELALCRQTCDQWSVIYEGAVSRLYADFCQHRKPEFATVQEELKMVHRIRNLHKRSDVVQLMMWAAARNYHLFLRAVLEKLDAVPEDRKLLLEEIHVADGTTPLHVACRNNHVETINLLVDRGANLNATDIRGQTPSHGAVVKNASIGLTTLVKIVKERKLPFDLNRTSSSGRTMLYEACGRGYESIAKTLLIAGGRRDMVLLATADGDGAALEGSDLSEGKSVMEPSSNSRKNVLHDVPCLVEKGDDLINIEASTAAMGTLKKPELGTALCAAAHNGRVGCLKLLLRCKANVNALSTDKRSPLFLAAEGGHLDCVRAILKLRPPNFTSFEEEKLEAEKENIKIQENDPEDQSRVFPFSVDIDLQGDSGKSPLFI
eukprot:g7562.t1